MSFNPPSKRPLYKTFGEAPANYVAGLGRGATGFTTRSDIGPAREATPAAAAMAAAMAAAVQAAAAGAGAAAVPGAPPRQPVVADFGKPPPGYVAGRGRGAFGFGAPVEPPMPGTAAAAALAAAPMRASAAEDDGADEGNVGTFDQWSGYQEQLFNDSSYDKEDEEADRVWMFVDKRMEQRKTAAKKRTAAEANATGPSSAAAKPTPTASVSAIASAALTDVHNSFSDLKSGLATVSEDEWAAIPDIGDKSIKRRRIEFYTPLPDTLLERARQESSQNKYSAYDTTSPLEAAASAPASAAAGGMTDLRAMGEARGHLIKSQLKKIEDSISGKSTIDPRGYLTSLNSMNLLGTAEIQDLGRARELLKSLTKTNPLNPDGWISRARVEELAGKMSASRSIIMEGCEACPKSEDVWLEAARLHPPDQAKAILALSVKELPLSVNIWIAAANLETSAKGKRRVLRKALEQVPESVMLWKEAIELEEPEEARIMLSRAVECIPSSVDLWLALARLESYESARKVLNKARTHLPTEPLIWIAAAELEEANGNLDMIDKLMPKALKSLQANGVTIKREDWIRYAYAAEEAGHKATCHVLIRSTIGVGIEEADRKHTWIDDAKAALAQDDHGRQHVETARAIYAHALSVFPNKKSLWRRAALLEKEFGSKESLVSLLQRSVQVCPNAEELWLMAAKEMWLSGDVQGARKFLEDAFKYNKYSEDIWLAAVKLESSMGELTAARTLLAKARELAPTSRVWMKSAQFERNLGEVQQEQILLDQGLKLFPKADKLWLMSGQLEETQQQEKAREAYISGLKNCLHSIPLWLFAAKLEVKLGQITKARALLEKARLRNPAIQELWLAAVRLEIHANNVADAQSLLAKALQECPTSGILLAESIEMEPRPKQRAAGVQALKTNSEHPSVLTSVAKFFWRERKIDTARSWFKRATNADKTFGDAWAHWFMFELRQGTAESQQEVKEGCVAAEPKHGELWTLVSKIPVNYQLKTEEILERVAAMIDENKHFTEITTYVAPASLQLAATYDQQGRPSSGSK